MKKKPKKVKKVLGFSLLAVVILALIIIFAPIQSSFDNDAPKHYTWFTGEDILDGYEIFGEDVLSNYNGVGVINITGAEDYIDTNYNLNNAGWTMSVWVMPQYTDFSNYLLWQGRDLDLSTYIVFSQDGRVNAVFRDYSNIDSIYTPYEPVAEDKLVRKDYWTYVVVTYNSTTGTAKIYGNGELMASEPATYTNPNWGDGKDTVNICSRRPYSTAGNHFGLIGDYAMYDRELNATEIANNYDSQKAYFVHHFLTMEHSKDVRLDLGIDDELCTSTSLNDLYNETICRIGINQTVNITWFSDTQTVTNNQSELTFNMTEDRYVLITSTVNPTSSGSGGSGSSTAVVEVVDEIIPEEESISAPSLVDNGLSWIQENWILLSATALVIGIVIGILLIKRKN